jgi:stage V sporulation protein S
MSTDNDDLIKVAGKSDPQAVGSVIARSVVAGQSPVIRAIGAGPVNQAVKACAIARGFVAPRGIDLVYVIGFEDIVGDSGDTISAISLRPIARS